MSKIENLTEAVAFRMSQIASQQFTEHERNAISDFNQLQMKVEFTTSLGEQISKTLYEDWDEYSEKLREYRERMDELTPDWLKNECAKLGVERPSDFINIHTRLGNVLFDFYRQMQPIPQAPLAQALHKKKMMEYAELLDKDEFVLPPEVIKATEKVLTDDELWKKTVVSAWVELPGDGDGEEVKKHYMTLRHQGLMQYRFILASLLDIFMPKTKEG